MQSKENGVSQTEYVYVNNNHIKYVLENATATETRVMRKEGNKITEHSVLGVGGVCSTYSRTQADFDEFYNLYLSRFFSTLECDKVTALEDNRWLCLVESSNNDKYSYYFSSDFHLTRITLSGSSRTFDKEISYRLYARAEDFVVPNEYGGCDARAYIAPTAGVCYRPAFTPHELPCEFHIYQIVTVPLGVSKEQHFFVNKNYLKYSYTAVGAYHDLVDQYNMTIRKDNDNITTHKWVYGYSCRSNQGTQADFDDFFDKELYSDFTPYDKTIDCDRIEDRTCVRFGDDGYQYNFNFNDDGYLTGLTRYGAQLYISISYNFTVVPSDFLPSECVSSLCGCDPIAFVEPTEGLCTASDDTTTPEPLNEWEIHIEFEYLDLNASALVTGNVLRLLHKMSGVDVSNMRIDIDTDANGKVSGVTLYVSSDEDVANGVLKVVNGCKSEGSATQCLDIFHFVKSASMTKSDAFTEGCNSIKMSSITAILSLMMAIITLYFSH